MSQQVYEYTRGPWTAMPALIEEEKQTKLIDIFTCGKKLFKTGVILWENARCVLEISTGKPEKLPTLR